MKARFVYSLCLMVVVFCVIPLTSNAVEEPQVFTLPDARAGESYRVEVEALLREKYRLRLEGSSGEAILQWSLVDGELPAGLAIRADGILLGAPQESGPRSYRFRIKVVDASVPDEALTLDCVLNVKAPGLRLVKINGPMLVPLEGDRSAADRTRSSPGLSGNDNRTGQLRPLPTTWPNGSPVQQRQGKLGGRMLS